MVVKKQIMQMKVPEVPPVWTVKVVRVVLAVPEMRGTVREMLAARDGAGAARDDASAQRPARFKKKDGKKGGRRDKTMPRLDDDSRHAFDTSGVLIHGLVYLLCPHGMLIEFEVLESAKSPACISEALDSRLALINEFIYLETACHAARYASRRRQWLLRLSLVRLFLDRFYQPEHVCSDMFNADQYPVVRSLRKNSVAESRHALNKPLRNQVAYMTQDRFICLLRLCGALSNLCVMKKQRMQPGVGRPAH